MILEAILLGASTGTYCSMYCGPVLIPFLCGTENPGYKRNAGLTGAVFAGLGYLVNDYIDQVFARKLSLFAYIFSGLILLCNSLGVRFPWGCSHNGCKVQKLHRIGNDWVTAVIAGLAVGLHICPPLWTAMTRSIFGGHGLPGLFYFVFFYIGTLPFFIPLLGIPFITKRVGIIRKISRIAQFFISIYFIYFLGLQPLIFG